MPVTGTFTLVLWLVGSMFGGNDSISIHTGYTQQKCQEEKQRFEDNYHPAHGFCIAEPKEKTS